jgi:hypothetical protein
LYHKLLLFGVLLLVCCALLACRARKLSPSDTSAELCAPLPAISPLQPDGSGWRCSPSSSSTAEKTLLGLAVSDHSLALVNGALPSSFDQQHQPGSWWMEAIFKVSTGSEATGTEVH